VSAEMLIDFPPFRLDVLNQQLWRDKALVPVRPKPFAVLAYLATHTGRLVTAAELRNAIWPDTYVSEGVLRGYIREVRQVLGDDAAMPRFIETIPRRGYRFLAAVTAATVPSSTAHVPRFPSPASLASEEGTTIPSQPETWDLQPSPLLVGRERELTQLHQWLANAAGAHAKWCSCWASQGSGRQR
jgi:DNA-binding winged helix-turn-helix (wHTH) protein